jgi:NADPH:quinone reductase-like Zn-dependent oxidoreductase/aryl carrier-like protein
MEMMLASLGAQEQLQGFIHLWNLDITQPAELTVQDLDVGQQLGCISIMHLFQAVLEAGHLDSDHLPRLLVVTSGAHPVGDGAEAAPATQPGQSPVWGLLRVLSNELPQLKCQTIDLDPDDPDFLPVVEELRRLDGEPETAWRKKQRYVNRMIAERPDRFPPRKLPRSIDGHAQPFRLEMPTPGVLERLALKETGLSDLAPGEVRVQVHAAGLNFRDVMAALGILPDEAEETPAWLALGLECAGTICGVGPSVTDRHCGQRVLLSKRGVFATHVTVAAEESIPIPESLSFEHAATIPVAFSTAYLALLHFGRITADDKVLIHAATGGVGLAAIQLCQRVGAEIFATAGNTRKRDYLRSLGITHVMSSRSLDFAEEIMAITNGRGVDVVLNSLSGDFLQHSLDVLASSGRFLEIGKRDIYSNSPLGMKAFSRGIQFFGIDVAKILVHQPDLAKEVMQQLLEDFAADRLRPLPLAVYPVSQAETAFRDMSQAKHIGKLALSLDDPDARVVSAEQDKIRIRSDATYLVTGATSGFGLRAAQWLVEKGAQSLLLVSRSGESGIQETGQIERLRQSGAAINIVAADISVYEDAQRVISIANSPERPLGGLIHSAAVFDDGILFNLDQQRFESVLSPKVAGGWNLHVTTLDLQLDFFVLFSSLSADFGMPGQANYAAANSFLNSLANYRRQVGLPALVVNWGALEATGFIARNEDVARVLSNLGIGPMSPETALDALELVMSRDIVDISVASLDWEALSASTSDVPLRRRVSLLITDHDHKELGHRRNIMNELAAVDPEQAVKILESFLRHEIARILGVKFESVEPDWPLQDLGLDSLAVFELQNSLEAQTPIRIPLSKLKAHPTIEALASLVLSYIVDPDRRNQSTAESAQRQTVPDTDAIGSDTNAAVLASGSVTVAEG